MACLITTGPKGYGKINSSKSKSSGSVPNNSTSTAACAQRDSEMEGTCDYVIHTKNHAHYLKVPFSVFSTFQI